MILKPENTTVTYRCPYCGEFVESIVGVFSLSGSLIRIKCTCGKSELQITNTSDGKVRLSVPCLVCEKEHMYTVSKNVLFSSDLFSLSCMYSDLDICFIGNAESIKKAQLKANEELQKILDENGIDDYFAREEDEDDSDILPSVDYSALAMAIAVIKELAEDGNIHCGCTESARVDHSSESDLLTLTGDYENNCNGDFIFCEENGEFVLKCLKCGKKFAPPVENGSSLGYDSFLTADSIELK